ncbi:MAG: YbaN family protein [Candidatus Marinimicrobia bacterium]|nr:YbaN family protein [Candidatus Neomarinimicrobiota bacterium]
MFKKYLYICLGLIFVGLGFFGIIIPGIPTTPFVLLAAWFFSRSSQRLDRWLINHKTFGPFINDWKRYKGIKRKSKILSICVIIPTFSISIYSTSNFYLQSGLGLFCISLITYLLTRPEPPITKIP